MADQLTSQNSVRVASHPEQHQAVECPLHIEFRPLFSYGGVVIYPNKIVIALADDLTESQAKKTLWHEIIHVLMSAGKHAVHNETEVEALAVRLAIACPEILSLCGVETYFTKCPGDRPGVNHNNERNTMKNQTDRPSNESPAPAGSAFCGHLAKETPLRRIFPNGMIPLTGPLATEAVLGEGTPRGPLERVYFVAVSACTPEQQEGMAQLMHSMGQGTLEEARKVVGTKEPIPIRERNLSGVSFPLRYVI